MTCGKIAVPDDKIVVVARKYKTRTEFATYDYSIYNYARLHDKLDMACAHMKYVSVKNWTDEQLMEVASKYSTRTQFAIKSSTAYNYARLHDKLDIICSHMKRSISSITHEIVMDNARKCKTRTEFIRNYGQCYYAAKKYGWYSDIQKLLKNSSTQPTIWTIDKLTDLARTYNTKSEFRNGNRSAYVTAHKLGIIPDICGHMHRKINPSKWNHDVVALEASKYKTRSAFMHGSSSAYMAATRYKWLDSVCAHMPAKTIIKWTKEHIFEEALKYECKSDFYAACPVGYVIAHRKGWFANATSHMKSKRKS